MLRALVFGLVLLAMSPTSAAADNPHYGAAPADAAPLGANVAYLRVYQSGAGPTAIFRLGTDEAHGQDVFGIVDPVNWRIQFFALDVWRPGGPALSTRMHWRGACELAPTLRVWRVHAWPGQVVLQLQPEPTMADIESQKDLKFKFRKVTLPADADAIAAIQNGQSPGINDRVAKPCDPAAGQAPFTAADTAVVISGGDDKAFQFDRRPLAAPALAPAFLTKRIWAGGDFAKHYTKTGGALFGAQELDYARSPNSHVDLRYFLVTARSGALRGIAHTAIGIIRRSANGSLDGTLQIDLGMARVKTGQRYAAVGSTGEVLIVGASDHKAFYIHACHFYGDLPGDSEPCAVRETGPSIEAAAGADAAAAATLPVSGRPGPDAIWQRAHWFADQRYRIDPSGLPKACQDAAPCDIPGHPDSWLVISALRWATAPYTRRGVPYAQRRDPGGIPSQLAPTADLLPVAKDSDGAIVMPVYELHDDGVAYLVSDIDNDQLKQDGLTDVKLFGIDCSAFLSAIWTHHFSDTSGLIAKANAGSIRRLDGIGDLQLGDALVFNLSAGSDPLSNHVVMYRGVVPAGPADSSRAFLVLEASSSCGGVCTSLYDESFFDGWGLVRDQAGPGKTVLPIIPTTYGEWRTLIDTVAVHP